MGITRRVGTLAVTGHEASEERGGGVKVLLAPAYSDRKLTRVVLHFHTREIAETLFRVGDRFDLLLEPVSQP